MKMKILVSDDVRMTNGTLWNEDNDDAFNFFVSHFSKQVGCNLHGVTVPLKFWNASSNY